MATSVLISGCQQAGAPAPLGSESAAYVVTLGNDTVAVNQYTRSGNRIEGVVLDHLPRTQITRYILTLHANGRPAQLEATTRLPDGRVPENGIRSTSVTYTADSAFARIQLDTVVLRRVAANGAFTVVANAIPLYGLPMLALEAMNVDSADLQVYNGGPRTVPITVLRKGPSKYWLVAFGFSTEVTLNDRGQVETLDSRRTTLQLVTKRQDRVDIPALMTDFAQREDANRTVAALSVRDTVNVTVGGAQLWVDYGRPLTRGRKVFGATGVLGDSIWRTGANAATQFRTSVPLSIGGQTIPAGMYTLWTVAIPGRFQLIINRQVGQWGTQYDPTQDLVRVPMQLTSRPTIEQFTIAVARGADVQSGVLSFSWDTTELSVPFTTR